MLVNRGEFEYQSFIYILLVYLVKLKQTNIHRNLFVTFKIHYETFIYLFILQIVY